MLARIAAALLLVLTSACVAGGGVPDDGWEPLFDGRSLDGWARTAVGGGGEVTLAGGEIVLEPGAPLTGLHWIGAPLPVAGYELSLTAARLDGTDFFCGLTFPVGDAHATLILGGWGSSLCGLSCLDGADASANETRTFRTFVRGTRYAVRVRVDRERVRAWVDEEPLIDVVTARRFVSLRPEVSLSVPLGIASFATRAAIGPIRIRRLDAQESANTASSFFCSSPDSNISRTMSEPPSSSPPTNT